MGNRVRRVWKVYGRDGHRQRESFFDSFCWDFSEGDEIRVISVFNSDVTGTNNYCVVVIESNTYEECERVLDGQLSDGIFENSNYGKVEEIKIRKNE